MPFQQKNLYASIFSSLLIFGIYFWRVSVLYTAGRFDGDLGNALIGKSILWLIGGGIVVHIGAMMLFSILFAIAANDPKPSFVVDERDRQFELHAVRASFYIFGAGYVVSMIALAMGGSSFLVFNMIVASMGIATMSEAFMQLYQYRRGG